MLAAVAVASGNSHVSAWRPGTPPTSPGTWAAYVTDKCRCAQCRALKSSYMKDYPGQAAVGVRPEPQQRL